MMIAVLPEIMNRASVLMDRKGRRSTRTFPLAWARPRASQIEGMSKQDCRRVTVAFGLEAALISSLIRNCRDSRDVFDGGGAVCISISGTYLNA